MVIFYLFLFSKKISTPVPLFVFELKKIYMLKEHFKRTIIEVQWSNFKNKLEKGLKP